MQLSVLVVSRTAQLLSTLLSSLDRACSLPSDAVEVLCSWNGSASEEQAISNPSRFSFRVVQRDPYHFASNVNGLIEQASGSLLMLVNDDVILDAGCVDAGLRLLTSSDQIGLVGGLLRTDCGRLSHVGIAFDHDGNAYHVLDQKLVQQHSNQVSTQPVAAVTGALQWLRRSDALPLNTQYRVCGEDIALCLDMQQQRGKQVWLCSEAKALHNGETTRQRSEGQGASADDQARVRQRWDGFIAGASAAALAVLLKQQQWESHMLRVLAADAHRAQRSEREALQQQHQATLKDLEVAHQSQLMDQREALKAERSLQLQQARQATRLVDDLQAERLHLKALVERSQLPTGPRQVKP
jgi:GT2 family glycosyltransferase